MRNTRRQKHLLSITALVGLLAGCPSKAPQTRPDKPQTSTTPAVATPAASQLMAAAQQAEKEGRLGDALALYTSLADTHPKDALAPDAMMAGGMLALKLENLSAARSLFERVAMNHPTHPAAQNAKLQLATLDLKEGRTQEGLSGLKNAIDQVQDPVQRQQGARDLGLGMMKAGQNAGAVASLAAAEKDAPNQAERDMLRAALVDLVEGGLDAREMLELRESLPVGAWTRNLLTLKLARVYLHIGDEMRAKDEFNAFIAAEPTSPFLPNAQAALHAIETRNLVSLKRLGVVVPLSGKFAPVGERLLAALKLGLESSIQEGIARGQTTPPPSPVEIVALDDPGETEDAAKAIGSLVQEQKVMAVAGAITLNGARAAAIQAESLKVPLMSLARRDGVSEMGPYTFQMSLTDERQAREMARIAASVMGYKRVALLYPRLPRGVALINAFWDEFEARGGQVSGVESYDHDETTFSTPVRKLVGRHYLEARGEFLMCRQEANKIEAAYKKQKALEACKDNVTPQVDFEALFIADYHGPVGLIAPALAFEDVFVGNDERALRSFKETTGLKNVRMVQLLGTNGFNDKSLPTRGGKYVQGALFVDGFNPNDGRPETLAFLKAFQAATGKTADLRDAQAYDAGRMLGAVFASNPQSRAEFMQRLGAMKDFPGVTGPTSMDANGSALTPLHVFTIKGDHIVPANMDKLERRSGG